ncbi:MAG: Mth938-like domain-containing protein [Betaproteobacteria bacterium]|nr:Mth938-like domain-containing protein [Betaproteobacteria bacterium]
MKLHLDPRSALNRVTAYGEVYVAVNGRRFESGIILMPGRIVEDWCAGGFSELGREHIEQVWELEPEVVLLGTGMRQRFPRPDLLRPLAEAGIGVEVMTLHAACRTYNVLMSEGRRVAAALLFS